MWKYQIVKYKDGSGYGVHEVYYEKGASQPWGMGDKAETFDVDDTEDAKALCVMLADALRDCLRSEVLEEPVKWADPPFDLSELGSLPDGPN